MLVWVRGEMPNVYVATVSGSFDAQKVPTKEEFEAECIEVIKAALEQAGSGLHHVVRTRVILTDIDNWKAAIDVRKEYFREIRPVDTIMAVDRFVNPEWLIEIEADAVIDQ